MGWCKRLRNTNTYQNIPLIIQGYDPVCHRNELGTTAKTTTIYGNPLNPLFNSVVINMDKVFSPNKRNNLALLDIHGGAQVKPFDIHSFTFKPQNIDLTWWKQTWVNYEHTDMGGNFDNMHDTVTPGYQHIMKKLALFASYQPPGAIGKTTSNKCPINFPKQVGNYSDGKSICKAVFVNRISQTKCVNRSAQGRVWNDYCIWNKNKYWHARTLKPENKGGLKCSALLPKRIGDFQGKPVCRAALNDKIKPKNCVKKKGMQWNGYCLWGKKYLWHARTLKAKSSSSTSSNGSGSPTLTCPGRSNKIGVYMSKAVCKFKLSRSISVKKCKKKGGSNHGGYCYINEGSFYRARAYK